MDTPFSSDWQCKTCGAFVLYLRDHKTDCKYYVDPRLTWVTNN